MTRTCRGAIRLDAKTLRALLDLPPDARIAAVEARNNPIGVDVLLTEVGLPGFCSHDLTEAHALPHEVDATGRPRWFPAGGGRW